MDNFEQIWSIYEKSFPPQERRSKPAQRELLKNKRYRLLPFCVANNVKGFIGFWDLDSFIFVEHLAVKKEFRSKGFGKQILTAALRQQKPVILEVEYPADEGGKRRIDFYRRLGFSLNDYAYFQPPYEGGQEPVPMLLMSYPRLIRAKELKEIVKNIHTLVYEYYQEK